MQTAASLRELVPLAHIPSLGIWALLSAKCVKTTAKYCHNYVSIKNQAGVNNNDDDQGVTLISMTTSNKERMTITKQNKTDLVFNYSGSLLAQPV